MSEQSTQYSSTKFSKDQLIQIFRSSALINKSIENLFETIPEVFSKGILEPENSAETPTINMEDVFVQVSEPTPRPMRLVTQKRTIIPKAPFQSSGYAEDPAARVWYYIDEANTVQGPFTSLEMDFWLESGFFFNELLIRIKENNDFVKLIHLFGKTEIIQVYRPAPFGMVNQSMTRVDSCPKSAELNSVNTGSKLIKKQSIYNFGFELETSSSATLPSTKAVDAPQIEKDHPLKAERRETADTNNYQGSPKSQEQKEANTSENEALNLGSPITIQNTVNLTVQDKYEEPATMINRNSSEGTERILTNPNSEMPVVTKSGRSSQESKNSKQEDADKKVKEKKSQAKKRGGNQKQQQQQNNEEKAVEYFEKDTKKENNAKNYREKFQYLYIPKNKEPVQPNAKDSSKTEANKKKDKQNNYDKLAKEKTYQNSPKPLNNKSKSDKNVKSKKNQQEASSPNFKVTEKIVFVAKKKALTPSKILQDPSLAQSEHVTPQSKRAEETTDLERRVSESYEMLKANSELFPHNTQQCNQAQVEIKSTKSSLNPQAAAFEPTSPTKNGMSRLKKRSKVLLKTNLDYEEAQARLLSSSLNLLDLEERLTPSKTTPVKSSFKSISAGPSPILLSFEKKSSNNLYDFSDSFKPPTFGQIGNSYSESLYE